MTKRTLAVILLVAGTQSPLRSRGTLSPELVQTAITLGSAAKEAPFYEVRRPGFVGSSMPRLGYFTTPYLRVAQAAYEAKKQHKSFSVASVTPAMTASELHVYGIAQVVGARVANVQNIVITPKDAHEAEKAIHPTSMVEIPVEFRNLMGMEAQGKSLLAVFLLDALREGFEIHIIYDSGVPNGSRTSFCEDCFMEFDLKKIK